jgi:hypothetical protein
MIIDAAPRRIIVIDEEEGIVVCSLAEIPRSRLSRRRGMAHIMNACSCSADCLLEFFHRWLFVLRTSYFAPVGKGDDPQEKGGGPQTTQHNHNIQNPGWAGCPGWVT